MFFKKDTIDQTAEKGISYAKTHKRIVFLVLFALFATFLVLFIVSRTQINSLEAEIDLLKAQKDELSTQMSKNEKEMQEQIELLSNQVAEQIAAEEQEAIKHYPNGLPVSGKVTITEQPVEYKEETSEKTSEGNETQEKEPDEFEIARKKDLSQMVIFGANHGAKVMAAGSGTVIGVEDDIDYGKKVVIDHGNGYKTVYRYNDTPKVKEGDDILQGQLLFEVNFVTSKVGYQIMYDDEYINPMDVMEISG